MRAYVDAKAFSEALNSVSKLLPKSSLPILECVLIRFENGRCALTASNIDTWLTLELPARGDDFFLVLQKPLTARSLYRQRRGAAETDRAGSVRCAGASRLFPPGGPELCAVLWK